MSRHAPRLIATVVIALPVALSANAHAQLPPSKYDQLQRTLEQKFTPMAKERVAPAPGAAGTTGKDDFLYIEPKDKPNAKPKDKKTGAAETGRSSLYASVMDKLAAGTETAEAATLEAAVGEPTTRSGSQPRAGDTASVQRVADNVPDKVPVAKPNSYVIQLKPTADDRDISELLKKYNLTITKTIAPLGVITVEVNKPVSPKGAPVPESVQSSDPKERLEQILDPPLIQDLRKEGAVDGAFVNSTMGAKHLPKPQGAKVVVDGQTYSWRWGSGTEKDGNWGLKAMRVPAVWTILEQYRKTHPGELRPKIGIIDGGFTQNPDVKFGSMIGVQPLSFHTAGCGTHHGMHVAGIIGAKQGSTPGIDGIVPDARMDAIAVEDKIVGDSGHVGVDQGWEVHALLFDDVLAKTLDYVYANLMTPDGLRVVNISLGYNFVAANLLGNADPSEVPGLALHILHQSNLIRLMANRVKDHVLFVVAAGNDSDGRATPVDARWASPFAWAGTQDSSAGDKPDNILVVEAVDRDGSRASFSNTGGHVSAPGVGIMSTLASGRDAEGVCSGTSQAAPHVAALAAILFELDPTKTPADIANVIKGSAILPKQGSLAAASVDALDAVLKLSPANLRLVADLDGDGKITAADLRLFAHQLALIDNAATTNAAFTEDLNGDGVIDDNECFFPRIDLNGSGYGSAANRDLRDMGGSLHSDLGVFEMTWTDDPTPFNVAVNDAGLAKRPELYAALDKADTQPTQCRRLAPASQVAEAVPTTRGVVPESVVTLAASSKTPVDTTNVGASSSDPAEVKAQVEKAVEDLRKSNPNLRVTINPATGLPSSVSGLSPVPGSASLEATKPSGEQTEEETRHAVEKYFGQGGISSLYPAKNKMATPQYTGRRKDPDFPDRYIAEVEQRIGDIPVFGSTAKLTVERSLGVTKFNGTTSNVAIDDTTAKVAEADAIATARAKLTDVIRTSPDASRAFPLAPNPDKADAKAQLLVFDPALVGKTKSGPTRLAYMVSIDSFRIFVDAKTGEAFYYYRDQPSGMLRRVYDLAQMTTFPGTDGIDEETRARNEGLSPEALIAFRNSGIVRDFYFLMFGRDGYDDNDGSGPLGGSTLESYVRYGRTQNAYWCTVKSYDCPKGNVMVYGPGYAAAIDVVGHEMTHGVIAHEKNLLYLNEPGAVNESLADIFGTLIEFDAKGDGGNWLIGEQSPGFSVTQPLRSLADPHLKDENGNSEFDRTKKFTLSNRGQPDHYSEVLTGDDEQCASTAYQDNGCVHFNSGILNKFAYLISEGGTHHGVTVTGIGRYKLARIAYRAMTAGLNQSSGLTEAANVFTESCFELANANMAGLTPADCDQVAAAQHATGLLAPST